MKYMNQLLLYAVLALLLSGCASTAVDGVRSVTDAGVTTVDIGPTTGDADEINLGTQYHAIFGKEYGSFRLEVSFNETGSPAELKVTANEVGAFPGQANAAAAIVQIQQELSDLGINITEEISGVISNAVLRAMAPAAPPE